MSEEQENEEKEEQEEEAQETGGSADGGFDTEPVYRGGRESDERGRET